MHAVLLLAAAASPVSGSETAAPPARPLVAPAAQAGAVLPAQTEVAVMLNEAITSKSARKGDAFRVTVARDVVLGDRVVIPRGTPGVGEVTWRTGRGAFGKSGKVEIAIRSIEVAGRSVPLSGAFREAGDGNTGATIGAVLAAGVIAGALVTGHTATFEQGRELRAFTTATLAVDAGAAWAPPSVMVVAPPAPMAVAPPAVVPTMAAPEAVRPAPSVAAVPASAVRYVAPVEVAPLRVVPAGIPAAPVAETYREPAATPAQRAFARRLAAQGGVRGREPNQGWSISD